MAKRKKELTVESPTEEPKKKNGFLKKFLIGAIVVVFLVAGVFAALVKLDIFGIGTQIVAPKIQNIPIINLILPKTEMTIDETGLNETQDLGDYNFQSLEQAVEKLKATEILLKEKEQQAETLNSEIELINKEIERLKVFEQKQVQFEADKAAFDQLVAEQAGPEAFMTYVEQVYPEQALSIYGDLVQEQKINDDIAEISDMYGNMKAVKAAAILEETTKTDIDMVSQILFQLEPSLSGAILAAMDPTVADKVSRYMYPDQTNP